MMRKVNSFALGAAFIIVITVFLPWLRVTGTANSAEFGIHYPLGSISGISIGYGISGFLIAIVGGILAFRNFKWSFLAGVVDFFIGLGFLEGWFGKSIRDSANYGDVTGAGTVEIRYGVYFFIVASIVFVIFTLKNLMATKKQVSQAPSPSHYTTNQQAKSNENIYASQLSQTLNTQKMSDQFSETPKMPEQPAASGQNSENQAVTEQPVENKTQQTPVNEPKVTMEPGQQSNVPEKKKSSVTIIVIAIVAVLAIAGGYFMTKKTTKHDEKTEQLVNQEKARLDSIINLVNNAVADKRYDDALLKINSINWLYEPGDNKDYVEQYNTQRENLRQTIEQLKSNQNQEEQQKAVEKEAQEVQETDNTPETVDTVIVQ